MNKILKIIKIEEGFRSKPYLCSEGYLTIGYGTKLSPLRNLDPRVCCLEVTRESAEMLLLDEVNRSISTLAQYPQYHTFVSLSQNRQAIIVSMMYQLGVRGVLKFRRMWSALERENWKEASQEALDSKWATQTPERAKRHAHDLAFDTMSS